MQDDLLMHGVPLVYESGFDLDTSAEEAEGGRESRANAKKGRGREENGEGGEGK